MTGTEIALQGEDEENLGPAMLELDARRRRFVRALVDMGIKGKATAAARVAGYAEKTPVALRVTAHSVLHHPKVQAAIHEESVKMLGAQKILAVASLTSILKDPEHPRHFEAIRDFLDRSGLGAKTEHKVTVERVEDDSTRLRKIKDYCDILGLTVEERRKLLGNFSEAAGAAGVIDVPAVEADADP